MFTIKKKKIYSLLFLSLFLVAGVFLSQINWVQAQSVSLENPLGDVDTPQELVTNIIAAVLALTGSLALVILIYGGATLLLSAGNQEKVAKAKSIIVWALIGLGVILGSYLILRFVFYVLQKGAGT